MYSLLITKTTAVKFEKKCMYTLIFLPVKFSSLKSSYGFIPRIPSFFFPSVCVQYNRQKLKYNERKPQNQKRWRPGNKATVVIYTSCTHLEVSDEVFRDGVRSSNDNLRYILQNWENPEQM